MCLYLWVLSAVATVLGQAGDCPVETGAQVLCSAVAIERAIAPGELHAYVLDVCQAELIRAEVQQQGADVVVRLRDPLGHLLTTVDLPSGVHGVESIALPPPVGGAYHLEVRAASGGPPGSYTLQVDLATCDEGLLTSMSSLDARGRDGRDPDEIERLMLASQILGEAHLNEAAELFLQGTSSGRRQAIDTLWQAVARLGAGDQGERVASTLETIGVLYRQAGDLEAARLVFRLAMSAWQDVDDPAGEARALNEIGYLGWMQGRASEALTPLRAARDLWRAVSDVRGEARAVSNMALCHLSAGDPRVARAHFLEALELARVAGDTRLQATVLNNLGGTFQVVGEPRAAMSHVERALELYQTLGDARGEARALTSLGAMSRALGEFRQALQHHLEALEIARRLEDTRAQASALNNIGLLYLALGEPDRAEQYLEQALPLRRRSRDRRGEAATLNNLAQSHQKRGSGERAIKIYRQALTLRQELGDRRGEATSLDRIGTALVDLGRLDEAAASFAAALRLRQALGDPIKLARTETNLAQISLDLGEPTLALEHLTRALELRQTADDPKGEADTLFLMARAEQSLGRLEKARQHIEASLGLIESLRARAGSEQMKATFLAANREVYETLIDVLIEMDAALPDRAEEEDASRFRHQALELSERARARSLLELLEVGAGGVHRGVDPDLVAEQQLLQERLGTKAARLLELGGRPGRESQIEAIQWEINDITARIESLRAEIRRHSPEYAALTQPRSLTWREIRQLADPDTVILVYSLGAARSFAWAVGRDAVEVFELPSREQIEAAARRLHEQWSTIDIRGAEAELEVAARLSRMILAPLASRLGVARIAVVADGALHYVPFVALPHPASLGSSRYEPLLLSHEVVSLPSASVLALQRQTGASGGSASRGLAVVADPIFRVDDPRMNEVRASQIIKEDGPALSVSGRDRLRPAFERLVASRLEAELILAAAPQEQATLLALDTAANRELITGGELGQYRYLHLATHGVIDSVNPGLSGLVLSQVDETGARIDGVLRLHDVYNLQLSADLVVLSACETALGMEVRGEGLIGLTRGFMHAGASRVLASLWRVQDRATAELMSRFYRSLLVEGKTPAAALRKAQLELIRSTRWRDPYYWAVFVLHGDWR